MSLQAQLIPSNDLKRIRQQYPVVMRTPLPSRCIGSYFLLIGVMPKTGGGCGCTPRPFLIIGYCLLRVVGLGCGSRHRFVVYFGGFGVFDNTEY